MKVRFIAYFGRGSESQNPAGTGRGARGEGQGAGQRACGGSSVVVAAVSAANLATIFGGAGLRDIWPARDTRASTTYSQSASRPMWWQLCQLRSMWVGQLCQLRSMWWQLCQLQIRRSSPPALCGPGFTTYVRASSSSSRDIWRCADWLRCESAPARPSDSVTFQADDLLRIVRQETELAHAEIEQNLRAEAVIAQVAGEAELGVRLHRVEPFFLQFVGVNLRRQTDAAAFLPHVNEHAVSCFGDLPQRGVQLIAAIAAARAEDVAGQAFAVHAHQGRLRPAKFRLSPARDDARHRASSDTCADRNRRNRSAFSRPVRARSASRVSAGTRSGSGSCRFAGHVSCGTPSAPAAAPSCRRRAGFRRARRLVADRPCAPDRPPPRCGPARRSTPPSLARNGKTWPGCTRSSGFGLRIRDRPNRRRAIVRADAGGHAVRGIDRDGEIGPIHLAVLRHHALQAELLGALVRDRRADQAAAVLGHEIDRLGRDLFRRHDQVALVFAIGIVGHDDDPAAAMSLRTSSIVSN